MGKIRKHCKTIGFTVTGKLRYMGMWDCSNRFYMDDAQNAYLIDTVLGAIRIIQPRRVAS